VDFKVDYKLDGEWSRFINLRYADDIILLATSEAEVQELADPLDRVSREYSQSQTSRFRVSVSRGGSAVGLTWIFDLFFLSADAELVSF